MVQRKKNLRTFTELEHVRILEKSRVPSPKFSYQKADITNENVVTQEGTKNSSFENETKTQNI